MNQFKLKTGTFTGAAAAINLNLGFVPDVFRWRMNEAIAAGDIAKGEWNRAMADGDAQVSKAIVDNGTSTTVDEQFETTNGITKLDTAAISPQTRKNSTAYVVGDLVYPAVKNGFIYECTTAGTSHSSEPAFGTTVGGTTAEGGGTVVWTCRAADYAPVQKTKVQGVTIGTGCMTDGKVYAYEALRGN
ncbi:MAG: hypothetical protein C4524_07360 [Candidatus Zixiibacteriota bacterium]|nr:MAG: hypothetical protein C4524_07360 [candidate division Zixibacteria bacterium]